jgi:hypothetical protein
MILSAMVRRTLSRKMEIAGRFDAEMATLSAGGARADDLAADVVP